MLRTAETKDPSLVSREIIFLKYSNLYDHDILTLQTDRQSDGRRENFPRQYRTLRSIAR